MQSISFDTGFKAYAINNDENRVIRINVADANLQEKVEKVFNVLEEMENKLKGIEKPTFKMLSDIDRTLKAQLDFAFGERFSETVFGGVNCFTVANEKGECILETFLNAFMPIVEKDIKEAAAAQKNHISSLYNEKTSKYIAPVISQIPQQNVDLSKLTEEQRTALVKELKG